MKKLLIFSFALLASVSTVYADKVKIGDLYYTLNLNSHTAQVVYENYMVGYNYYELTK